MDVGYLCENEVYIKCTWDKVRWLDLIPWGPMGLSRYWYDKSTTSLEYLLDFDFWVICELLVILEPKEASQVSLEKFKPERSISSVCSTCSNLSFTNFRGRVMMFSSCSKCNKVCLKDKQIYCDVTWTILNHSIWPRKIYDTKWNFNAW